jgi:hypothetical protein
LIDKATKALLDHIHSLGVISENNSRPTDIEQLLKGGLIYRVYIGNYALTEKGKHARRQFVENTD